MAIITVTLKSTKQQVSAELKGMISDGVYLWTETKSNGHTFLSIHIGKNIFVFNYGRYDDIDISTLGITGEGVLIRHTGDYGIDYIKYALYEVEAKAYKIKDVVEERVLTTFNKLWYSSDVKPDNPKKGEEIKQYGRVIDNYHLLSNNYTTKTCEGLKEAGTKIFDFEIFSYEKSQDFTIPSSLQKFLEEQAQTNPNVWEVTELMKNTFENTLNKSKIGKGGIVGEILGGSGRSLGGSSNSSSTDELSSGSGSGSKGGFYD